MHWLRALFGGGEVAPSPKPPGREYAFGSPSPVPPPAPKPGERGLYIYLSVKPGSKILNYRGVVREGDDPGSYRTKMEKKGHVVLFSPTFLGRRIDDEGKTLEE